MHYCFDYAQQVHYPSDPLQPGPMYFLTPRKCGIFGVCCACIPQQVNYLIDEGMCVGKGSNAVICYLHHFFANYGLGETSVHLHCDNCSGQNKNKFMIWYLAWRILSNLHTSITVNFMIADHTKFAPDWCFGLLKQKYRNTHISSLTDLSNTVTASTVKGINIPQLAGTEDGTVIVDTYNWHKFWSHILCHCLLSRKSSIFVFRLTTLAQYFIVSGQRTQSRPLTWCGHPQASLWLVICRRQIHQVATVVSLQQNSRICQALCEGQYLSAAKKFTSTKIWHEKARSR